jgi:uncharacterized membrane protein YbhN (UPF0104 family)
MPKNLQRLSYPLMIVVLAVLGAYLYNNSAFLYSTLKLNPFWLGVLCLLTLGRCFLNSLSNQITLAELGANTKSGESFSLTSIASALQMLFPFNAGAVFRAVYLKRRYQLSYSHFLSTQIGIQILGILISCAAAMTTLLFIADVNNPAILSGILLSLVCFCSALVLILFPRIKRRNHRLWDKLAMVSEGCAAIRQNRSLFLKLILLSIAKTACDALTFWCGSLSVGLEVGIFGALALTSVASLAACFRVTTGALGTYEALIGLVSQAASLSTAQAITVSLVIRTISYLIAFILVPLCSWWLASRYGFRWRECDESQRTRAPSMGAFTPAAAQNHSPLSPPKLGQA